MRYFMALLLAMALACRSENDGEIEPDTTDEATTTETTTVIDAVSERIRTETDCATLQQEFDTASDNFDRAEPGSPAADASLAYMNLADDRMQEVGCYD